MLIVIIPSLDRGIYLHRRHVPQVPISMLILYIEGAIQPLLTKPPENLYSESIFTIHKLVIRQKPTTHPRTRWRNKDGKISLLPET
jgi:hypothetical protein